MVLVKIRHKLAMPGATYMHDEDDPPFTGGIYRRPEVVQRKEHLLAERTAIVQVELNLCNYEEAHVKLASDWHTRVSYLKGQQSCQGCVWVGLQLL